MSPSSQGRLTDQQYWNGVWTDKARAEWSQPNWISGRYPKLVFDQLLKERLPARPGQRLLEVGCGTGKWLIYFSRTFGYAVTGCDYSENSCAMARRNVAAAGVEATILQHDLFGLSGEYDVVFSTGLIEHFDDPSAVLAKFASLLAPGGTLITLVPNLAGLSGLYHRWWKPETFTTHRVITLDELRMWYGRLGLRRLDAAPLGSVIPLRFPRNSVRKAHPWLYRLLWPLALRPLMWSTNRGCVWAHRRLGLRLESPRFSPNLYAVGERP